MSLHRLASIARKVRFSAILLSSLASIWLVIAAAHAAAPQVEFSRDASNVVLEYQEILPVGGDDRGPKLTVYGNGLVLVHRPVWMKQSGDYELQLSRPELDALVRDVAGSGLVELDVAQARGKLRSARAAAQARAGVARASTDPSTVDVRLQLDGYTPAAGPRRRNVDKRVIWTGLRADAESYGSIPEIRALAEVHARCQALLHSSDLEERP